MLCQNLRRGLWHARPSYRVRLLQRAAWPPRGVQGSGSIPRDRSIVTIGALIARNQTIEMSCYFNLALDNGVKPSEISEIVTHLAFYSGWANAMSAVAVAKDVCVQPKIGPDQLPPRLRFFRSPMGAEAKRAAGSEQQIGNLAPGMCTTPRTFYSATCGCVRTLTHEIGAS
jgi:hypothetical protein